MFWNRDYLLGGDVLRGCGNIFWDAKIGRKKVLLLFLIIVKGIDNDSIQLVKVDKDGSNKWTNYTFVLRPTSNAAQELIKSFANDTQTQELWERMQEFLKSQPGFKNVKFRFIKWSIELFTDMISPTMEVGD